MITRAQNGTSIHVTMRCQMNSITITSMYDSVGRKSVTVQFTIPTAGQTGHNSMQNINLKPK